ncbi:cytochrome P450 ClCP1 [Xylariomycetidae sp. FL0641]|nr:cytochrome P450 ClCP1 [Xylariomycetidae sp. FL0641]
MAIFGFTLYWILSALYSLYLHPVSKYPGPRLWAISRIPLAIYLQRGRLPHKVKLLRDKYGSTIRIAPDELTFIDGDASKDIVQPKLGNEPFDKWQTYLNPAVNGAYSILTAPTFQAHARTKRNINHGFSDKALQAQESMFQGHADLLMRRIHEHVRSGPQDLNMFQYYTWATSDIMGDLAFDHHWVSIWIQQFPAVVRMTCLQYAVDMVDKRLARNVDRPSFVHYLQRENKNSAPLTREELDATLSTLIIAGEAFRKLKTGISGAFASEKEINAISTNKLPPFNACVKEGLRLCPAVPYGHPRIVPPGGGEIGGQHIPADTKLTGMHFVMGRSERNFKDTETFVPERWLQWNEYDDYDASVPFSLGPRNCIGKNLALVELKILLARTIYNFDIASPVGKNGMDWEWKDHKIYMLWKCDPMVDISFLTAVTPYYSSRIFEFS